MLSFLALIITYIFLFCIVLIHNSRDDILDMPGIPIEMLAQRDIVACSLF